MSVRLGATPHPPHMDLCSLGHIALTRELHAAGCTRAQLGRALSSGTVVRLQRGTFACAHVGAPLATAASIGGALTCVSVLREQRVWAGHDHRVHVQLSPRSSAAVPSGVRVHRELARFEGGTWRVSPMQALWQAIRCLDDENALAAMESAILTAFLTEAEVRRLGAMAPRRLQPLIRQLVTTSGSGNETIVRVRLVAAGYDVEPQGYVPGLGHQDLIVDKRVALEIDSHEWHEGEQRATDADRDLVSEGLGRHVIRIRPAHIHESWPRTLAVIDRAVRDARRGQR